MKRNYSYGVKEVKLQNSFIVKQFEVGLDNLENDFLLQYIFLPNFRR